MIQHHGQPPGISVGPELWKRVKVRAGTYEANGRLLMDESREVCKGLVMNGKIGILDISL